MVVNILGPYVFRLRAYFQKNLVETLVSICLIGCFLCCQVFNVNLKQAAWFSAVPWGTMAFSGYVAGAASDFLIKAGYSLTFVRKVMQVTYLPFETAV